MKVVRKTYFVLKKGSPLNYVSFFRISITAKPINKGIEMILEVGVVIDVTEAMKIEIAEEKEVERKKTTGNQKRKK